MQAIQLADYYVYVRLRGLVARSRFYNVLATYVHVGLIKHVKSVLVLLLRII